VSTIIKAADEVKSPNQSSLLDLDVRLASFLPGMEKGWLILRLREPKAEM
jgi:hypothetical protein